MVLRLCDSILFSGGGTAAVAPMYGWSHATGFGLNTTGDWQSVAGRRGAGSLSMRTSSNFMIKTCPFSFGGLGSLLTPALGASGDRFFHGFAFKMPSSGSFFLQVHNSAGAYLGGVTIGGGNVFLIDSAGGTISVTAYPVAAGTWNYLELSWYNVGTSGAVVSGRVNGVTMWTDDAGWASPSSNPWPRQFRYAGVNAEVMDMVWYDDTGGVNDNWMGDVRVEGLAATAAGTHQGWTNVGGSDHVDSVALASDTDTKYIKSAGSRETFAMANLLSTLGTVKGVQLTSVAKAESGVGNLKGNVRIAGTDYNTTNDHLAPAGYEAAPAIFDINPATGVAWTTAEINALEAGPYA